jgi:hypothetical protein
LRWHLAFTAQTVSTKENPMARSMKEHANDRDLTTDDESLAMEELDRVVGGASGVPGVSTGALSAGGVPGVSTGALSAGGVPGVSLGPISAGGVPGYPVLRKL